MTHDTAMTHTSMTHDTDCDKIEGHVTHVLENGNLKINGDAEQ